MNGSDDQRNPLGFWPLLRRHALVVLVVAAGAAAAAYFVSDRQERVYSASSLIRVQDSTVDQQILAVPPGTPDSETQAATNVILVDTTRVSAATARRLGRGVATSEVESRVEVTSEGKTPIVRVTATGPSAAGAADLANVYTRTFARLQSDQGKEQITRSRELLERQFEGLSEMQQEAAQGQAISDRLLQLQLLESGNLTSPRIVQPAQEPLEADSPRPLRNAALGALFGLILGVGIGALRQQSDRRLRGQTDTERAFGAPVIATVPRSSRLRRGSAVLKGRDSEPFRLLQANLRYRGGHDDQGRSLVVTSPTDGDGKTTTAWNLAAAAAAAGGRVLLVEADMRRPTLSGRLGLDANPGLAQVLRGELRTEHVVQAVAATEANGSAPAAVDVIVAGDPGHDTADLTQGPRIRELFEQLERDYDLVVIDTPPINEVSDTIPLAKLADEVLVVGRLGHTTREQARRTQHQLSALDVAAVGVVANGARSSSFYDED